MRAAVVLLAVLVLPPSLGSGDRRPMERRSPLSPAQAESLDWKLQELERRRPAPARGGKAGSVLVTEGELNSYLNLSRPSRLPEGVSEVDVRLERDRVNARGMVDIERVKAKVSSGSSWSPLMFLSGEVPVEVRGRWQSQDGFGQLEVEDVRVAAIPVPLSVLEQMVSSNTRTPERPEGLDIHAPFRLPHSLKRVRLMPGRGFLDF